MYEPLTNAQEEVVTAVLFGKQRQASVINGGVVAIVGRGIAEATIGEAALESEQVFMGAVKDFLQTCVEQNKALNSILVMLIGGVESLVALQAEGPKAVYCESAGTDTPKFHFGIYPLGEMPDLAATPIEGSGSSGDFSKMMNPPQPGFIPEDLSYAAQRDYLVKTIVPLVPEAVKKELSSPVEQALVGAQWYFKNN